MPPRMISHRAIYNSTYYWKNLPKTIQDVCSKCKSCQFLKKQYGKLPPNEAESKPWDVFCVGLMCQYQFTPNGEGKKYQMATKNGKSVYLQTITMIDPETY